MNETSSGLIDWFTVAAQGINFLILIGLLKHFLYRPILTAIDAREKRVADQLAAAQQQLQTAATEQQQFHTAFVQRTQQTVFNLVRKVLAALADASLEARLVQRLCQQLPQLAAAQLAELQATPALTVRSAFPLEPAHNLFHY